MKKFLAILFLGFLLCSNALALTVDEAIKKFFTDRKLDPIEGIWIHKEGFIQAFVKEGRDYYRYMIEHKYDHIWPSGSKGEYPIRKTSTEKVYADQTTVYNLENINERATGSRTLIIENINFIKTMYSRGCWSQGRCWTPWESHYIRNWPDDFHAHNANIENESVVKWYKVAISKDIFGSKYAYAWDDFYDFIKKYDIVTSVIQTPEDYRELTYNYLKECAENNVIYVEAMISSTHAKQRGMTYYSFLEVVVECAKQAEK